MKFRTHIMRLANGRIYSDNSRGAWELFLGPLWVAHFGQDFVKRYGTTWAVGWRLKIWFYKPDDAWGNG